MIGPLSVACELDRRDFSIDLHAEDSAAAWKRRRALPIRGRIAPDRHDALGSCVVYYVSRPMRRRDSRGREGRRRPWTH